MSRREYGQTLLEVLVALGAIVLILSAVTSAILLSLRQSAGSTTLTRASQLAQEGLEVVKPQISTLAVGTLSCLDASGVPSPVTDCEQANLEGKYRRTVSVDNDPTECSTLKKVTVIVSWGDAACQNGTFCHSTPITTCL